MKKAAFDYTGYTDSTLLDLCSVEDIHIGWCRWRYWTAEIYSFGKYIREYGFYPRLLPLHVYTDHGPAVLSAGPAPHELAADAYCQFYHSPGSVAKWKALSNKHCFTMYSPFIFYRKKHKVEQLSSAKGTLAFPAHSTPSIDDLSNIDEYIAQLKALPEVFQPVCVCLHMHDINKMQHKKFMEYGISVYTAGNSSDTRFASRFYDLLKHFKYATSNIIGSYTYYAVEMGIPFSAYGIKCQFINNSDENLEKGEYKLEKFPEYNEVFRLFDGLQTKVTEKQRIFVETHLGLYHGLKRWEMAKVLYKSYLMHGVFKDGTWFIKWVSKCLTNNFIFITRFKKVKVRFK